MSKKSILKPDQSYTFRSYFEMSFEPEDILAEFSYSLRRDYSKLPRSQAELERLSNLKSRIEESLPYVSLSSKAARRELLIAPILLDLIYYTHAQLRIEYYINITEQLKGTLDYYLYSDSKLLIVEAKNADIARGFTQLAVELIALDRWTDSNEATLIGAVSTGDLWQFGILNREQKQITQNLNLYRVPTDLEELFRILIAILNSQSRS